MKTAGLPTPSVDHEAPMRHVFLVGSSIHLRCSQAQCPRTEGRSAGVAPVPRLKATRHRRPRWGHQVTIGQDGALSEGHHRVGRMGVSFRPHVRLPLAATLRLTSAGFRRPWRGPHDPAQEGRPPEPNAWCVPLWGQHHDQTYVPWNLRM